MKEHIYIEAAIKEARKAYIKGEVPVGAVIVKDNKIIGKGYNLVEKTKNQLNHAEMIAIKKACRKTKDWRLNECTLYVTLKPCEMCLGALKQVRIKKIVYCAERTKKNNDLEITGKIEIERDESFCECSSIIKKFFQEKRKK